MVESVKIKKYNLIAWFTLSDRPANKKKIMLVVRKIAKYFRKLRSFNLYFLQALVVMLLY